MPLHRLTLALAALLALAPGASARAGGALELGALWPNDDGRAWTYAERSEQFWYSPSVTDRTVRMLFDGSATAPGGEPVQLLRGQLLSGPPASASRAGGLADPLLRAVHAARPDLRAALEARLAAGGCSVVRAPGFDGVLLSPDLAFQKTSAEIGAWRCDLAGTRSWRFLVADLTLGNTFQLQLIPDLASDIILHGTMAAIEDVSVPAGEFPGCLRVDYRIDYGNSTCTDESGNPRGTYRSETRGSVHYASGVGPVASDEGFIPYAEAAGDCALDGAVGEAATRVTMRLASMPVDVRPASWGALKTRYR